MFKNVIETEISLWKNPPHLCETQPALPAAENNVKLLPKVLVLSAKNQFRDDFSHFLQHVQSFQHKEAKEPFRVNKHTQTHVQSIKDAKF